MEKGQKYPLTFFTDIQTNISNYCLLNIKSYHNKKKLKKKLIYIDPSVYELVKQEEYSKVDFMHILLEQNLLRENEYISIDYPCDMNEKLTDSFIQKSFDNNWRYRMNLKYICAIQSRFGNYKDFVKQTEKLKGVWRGRNKIIGIGNLCRIMRPNSFTNNVLRYLRNTFITHHQIYRLHFYGLSLAVMKSSHFRSLINHGACVSVDSTKWTKACTNNLKKKYGLNCSTKNRDEFFLEYIKTLQKSGIIIEY